MKSRYLEKKLLIVSEPQYWLMTEGNKSIGSFSDDQNTAYLIKNYKDVFNLRNSGYQLILSKNDTPIAAATVCYASRAGSLINTLPIKRGGTGLTSTSTNAILVGTATNSANWSDYTLSAEILCNNIVSTGTGNSTYAPSESAVIAYVSSATAATANAAKKIVNDAGTLCYTYTDISNISTAAGNAYSLANGKLSPNGNLTGTWQSYSPSHFQTALGYTAFNASDFTAANINSTLGATYVQNANYATSAVKDNAGNTICGTYANVDHMYHKWTVGGKYYSDISDTNNLRAFTETTLGDELRFKASTISNVEYNDGTSWISWSKDLSILFNGQENSIEIPYANRYFRFTIDEASGGWPLEASFLINFAWFDSGTWTALDSNYNYLNVQIETYCNTTSSFIQKENFNFTSAPNACYLLARAENLHNGMSHYRITIHLAAWSKTTNALNIRKICLLSGFTGNSLTPWAYDGYGNAILSKTIYASQFNGAGTGLTGTAANLSVGQATKLPITGYGNAGLTFYQTADAFDGSTAGWAHYLIANHQDGASYYHYTLRLPFGGIPQYRRQTGNTTNVTPWYNFITEENIASQSVNNSTYLGNTYSAGNFQAEAIASTVCSTCASSPVNGIAIAAMFTYCSTTSTLTINF